MQSSEVHAQLVKARNRIAKYGLTKGQLIDVRTKARCLSGAIMVDDDKVVEDDIITGKCLYAPILDALGFSAAPGYSPSHSVMKVASLHLYPFLGAHIELVKWNNEKSRTQEEVLARLDAAISKTAPMPEDPSVDDLVIEKEIEILEPV